MLLTKWPGLYRILGFSLLVAALVTAVVRWQQHRAQMGAVEILRERVAP